MRLLWMPVVLVAAAGFMVAGVVLMALTLASETIHFVLFGHAPTPAGLVCHVCGNPRRSAPVHRWQVLDYWLWLFEHSHPRRRDWG